MNRTRSDSRYLELESSTHCNGHEAERLSICLKTNTSRTTESPSFFLSLPPGPTSLSSMFPFSLFRSSLLLLVSSSRVSRPVRPRIKVMHFIRICEISPDTIECMSRDKCLLLSLRTHKNIYRLLVNIYRLLVYML